MPDERLITDSFRTLAYVTDVSFYRLVPKILVRVKDEAEMVALMRLASDLELPICFRGSDTSLSGQAITDSIMLSLTTDWKMINTLDDGERIRMQCSVLGREVNRVLAPYQKMLSLMPLSIDVATVGGMAINDAAGINSLDTYTMMENVRLILLDGTVLDTSDETSRRAFRWQVTALILVKLEQLASKLRSNKALVNALHENTRLKIPQVMVYEVS